MVGVDSIWGSVLCSHCEFLAEWLSWVELYRAGTNWTCLKLWESRKNEKTWKKRPQMNTVGTQVGFMAALDCLFRLHLMMLATQRSAYSLWTSHAQGVFVDERSRCKALVHPLSTKTLGLAAWPSISFSANLPIVQCWRGERCNPSSTINLRVSRKQFEPGPQVENADYAYNEAPSRP